MPFRPSGKKAQRHRAREAKSRELIEVIEIAMGAVHEVMPHRGLCLPMSYLLARVLRELAPHGGFELKLGALQVSPTTPGAHRICFDPRSPEGVDGGFHAWLEDPKGVVLDPSILRTLEAEGYPVDVTDIVLVPSRVATLGELLFQYEELPQLRLTGTEESEVQIGRLQSVVLSLMHGIRPPAMEPGTVFLDVIWSHGTTPEG